MSIPSNDLTPPVQNKFPGIRPIAFFVPFIFLALMIIISFADQEWFLKTLTGFNNALLSNFTWLFNLAPLLFLATCIWAGLSPLGRVRIGGPNAKRLLQPWNWFAITLCTTIAIGILFWAAAEPMYHMHYPPESMKLTPNSPEAIRFAMSTMYLHWSFTPYAIYTIAALAFTLAYYNLNKPFSLGSILEPALGKYARGRGGEIIDAICLYTLVAGMAASMGTGVKTLAGGLNQIFGLESSGTLYMLIAVVIISCFILSAASGLMKGIRILSDLNTKVFFLLIFLIFAFGPTFYMLALGTEALGEYLGFFFQKSLFTGKSSGDQWPSWWSVFYWCNWMSWAPITALFLGRIARGYTVRAFLMMNLVLPSLFAIFWMTLFSGAAIYYDINNAGAINASMSSGTENAVYTMFGFLKVTIGDSSLSLGAIIIPIFVFTSFISYVTAADSNTEAISRICSKESDRAPLMYKIIWGVLIGTVTVIMLILLNDVEGIKIMSNLGGMAAVLILLGANFSVIKIYRLLCPGEGETPPIDPQHESVCYDERHRVDG